MACYGITVTVPVCITTVVNIRSQSVVSFTVGCNSSDASVTFDPDTADLTVVQLVLAQYLVNVNEDFSITASFKSFLAVSS